jgi:UDP-N-acetylglucosamine diphosphorylase/glucosamine-1-phosphate N-acetyltransferase
MNYVLFDDQSWNELLPLSFTRPVSELRIGILTIREKWELFLAKKLSWKTQDYLSEKYPIVFNGSNNVWINGKVCPTKTIVAEVKTLKSGQALFYEETLIALNTGKDLRLPLSLSKTNIGRHFELIQTKETPLVLHFIWDMFSKNDRAIREDFELVTAGRKSQPISSSNKFAASEQIFIEKGAVVECSVLNASKGPIYIGKNAEVMEGCLIRGPFALGENAVLKMGAKIYGATTIGPHCKVGGEVNNSVFFSNSNKAHDGFIGNSVIGEWCNLGADTNNSNLKNNYGNVKIWSHATEEMVDTGLQFCGLIMGDHSKSGINTMFNTGTVVGVNANVFGSDFPIHFIPSFSWGSAQEFTDYRLEKALEVADRVMARRNQKLSEADKKILSAVFSNTKKFRVKEN